MHTIGVSQSKRKRAREIEREGVVVVVWLCDVFRLFVDLW